MVIIPVFEPAPRTNRAITHKTIDANNRRKKMMKPIDASIVLALALITALAGSTTPANAACTMPGGAPDAGAGDIIFNGPPHNVMQYCNGTNWVSMAGGGGGGVGSLPNAQVWIGDGADEAQPQTISGDATLSNAGVLTIGTGTVTMNKLSAGGTANGTTFLRGDGTWAAPPSGGDNLGAGGTTTGRIVSSGGLPASQGMATATGGLGSMEAWAQGSGGTAGAAFMAFHRPSSYAAYFGLDTDNKWKVGGWSMGANAYEVFHQGKNIDLQGYSITSSAGTVIDGGGGWHRTYGNAGWFNGTHGGGWNMEDSTWLRAYGGKGVYTSNVVRADSGIRTNQVCDINGANCVPQSSLGAGGSGGSGCAGGRTHMQVWQTGGGGCDSYNYLNQCQNGSVVQVLSIWNGSCGGG